MFAQVIALISYGIGAVVLWFQQIFSNTRLLGASVFVMTMILLSLAVRFLLIPLIGVSMRSVASDKVNAQPNSRSTPDKYYDGDVD